MEDKYLPVSCAFYDQLELLAMRRSKVSLIYELNEKPIRTEGIIEDVYSAEDRVEYLRLSSGEVIRLDHINQLNDTNIPDYC